VGRRKRTAKRLYQGEAAGVASPDAAPRIEAVEFNAVSTDASAAPEPNYSAFVDREIRIREQAAYEQGAATFFGSQLP